MKKFTRALALVLTICVMLGTVSVAAADYPDVKQSEKYYSAVSLLSALGIIKGYDDGTFGPEKNVTRAEFTVMLMRAMAYDNLGSSDPAGLPFTDLESVRDWAVSDIRTAYDLGIINGMTETTFEPDSQVTYEQALKMIVCALGYYPMALEFSGNNEAAIWPDGYLKAASQLALTTGLVAGGDTPSKRWEIAQMIYNALDVDLMEKITSATGEIRYQVQQDKTLLSDKLKIYYGNGELYADESVSAAPDGKLAFKGEALIYENETGDTERFSKGSVSTDGLVGHSVKYYYTEDNTGAKTLVYVEDKTKDSSMLTIDAEDLYQITGSLDDGVTIEYWPNEEARRAESVTLGRNPIITVNGRVVDNNDYDDPEEVLWPETGTLELLSTSNNGDFDKVNITSYETYVVKSATTTDHKVVDQYRTAAQNNSIVIDEDDAGMIISIKRTDGSEISFNNLKEWNVLSVKRSNALSGRDTMEVIVSTNSVTGEITGQNPNEKMLEIDGKSYKVSPYFIKYNEEEYEQLEVGDSSTFYLDKDGQIAAMKPATSSAGTYGYIAKVAVEQNRVEFAFMNQNATKGANTIYYGANRIKIDGTSYSTPSAVYDTLVEIAADHDINTDDGAQNTEGAQLVKYGLNSAGEINSIDTLAAGDNEKKEDLKLHPEFDSSLNPYKYDYSNKQFIGSDGKSTIRANNASFYLIPSDREEYDDYDKVSSGYFVNNRTYTIEAYDAYGDLDMAKVVLVYGDDKKNTITTQSPIAVVNEIRNVRNEYGEDIQQVDLYAVDRNSTGAVLTTVDTESVDTLEDIAVGDVIRYVTTGGGLIKDGTVEVLVSVEGRMKAFDNTLDDGSSTDSQKARVTSGLLAGVSADSSSQVFTVAVTTDIDEIEDLTPVTFTAGKNIAYFHYDGEQNEPLEAFEDGEMLDLSTLDSYASTKETDEPAAAEVFVYKYNNTVKAVYVIER